MYVIACWFKPTKDGEVIYGLDPDTPQTFIYPDGKPYLGNEIWDYKLQHLQPWAKLEL